MTELYELNCPRTVLFFPDAVGPWGEPRPPVGMRFFGFQRVLLHTRRIFYPVRGPLRVADFDRPGFASQGTRSFFERKAYMEKIEHVSARAASPV